MRNGDRESGVTYLGPRSFVIGFGAFLGGFLVLLYGVDKMTESSGPSSPLPPLPPSVSRLATLPAAPAEIPSPRSVAVRVAATPKPPEAAPAPLTGAAATVKPSSAPVVASAAQRPIFAASPSHSHPNVLAASPSRMFSHAGKVATAVRPPVAAQHVSPQSVAQAAPCHERLKSAGTATSGSHRPLPSPHQAVVLRTVAHSGADHRHFAAGPKRIAALPVHATTQPIKQRRPMPALLVPVSSAVLGADVVLDPRPAAGSGLVIVPAAAGAPPQAATGFRFRYLR